MTGEATTPSASDRLAGALLGTALGDALGLPWEGLKAKTIKDRKKDLKRFHFLGTRGFVSDDTEQSALVATSLARGRGDIHKTVKSFRRALAGWFLRLPWGLGLSTLRACLRLVFGFKRSGVRSAGNGAAMRAAVIGAHFADDPDRRRAVGRSIAGVTHTDPRGVQGALFVGEVAALCAEKPSRPAVACVDLAMEVVEDESLRTKLLLAKDLAVDGSVDAQEAAAKLGNSGFVNESVPLAAYCFLKSTGDFLESIARCVALGGDTDSTAAILGSWLGTRSGAAALPQTLVQRLVGGPFGPVHLQAIASALTQGDDPPRFSSAHALIRNLALYPVVLFHGFRRLFW